MRPAAHADEWPCGVADRNGAQEVAEQSYQKMSTTASCHTAVPTKKASCIQHTMRWIASHKAQSPDRVCLDAEMAIHEVGIHDR